MPQKKLIFVLGMHRSGTSACTRMLNLLGVDLGSELIAPQAGVNEKGFWENAELVRIDQALLTELGSDWYDYRPLPAAWWRGEKIKPYREEIRLFLDRTFSEIPVAALKDPRLCRLLPLWLEVVQETDWNPLAVVVLRNVEEVVASLCKRDPLPESAVRLLWLRYLEAAETASRPIPRSVVTYAGLLEDWASTAERIRGELRLEWPAGKTVSSGRVGRELDPRLRHHVAAAGREGGALSDLANRAYHLLSARGEVVAVADIDCLWSEFGQLFSQCSLFSDLAYDSNSRLIGLNRRLQEIGRDLEYARTTVHARDRTLRDTQNQLQELGKEHAYALGIVRERDEQLGQLGKEHAYALGIVRERDDQLTRSRGECQDLQHIISERDRQLSALRSEIEEAEGRLRDIMEHSVAGLVCRLFALGDRKKNEQD